MQNIPPKAEKNFKIGTSVLDAPMLVIPLPLTILVIFPLRLYRCCKL